MIPGYIYENILGEHYGWDLDQIRSLDIIDFNSHLHVCLGKEEADRQFQIELSGLSTAKNMMPGMSTKRFNPESGNFE